MGFAVLSIAFPSHRIASHCNAMSMHCMVEYIVNRLEVRMLEALRYAVVVTAQQYARYFFEVRALPSRETVLKRFKAPRLPKKESAE